MSSVFLLKRELARAWSSLKLEEHRNRKLPELKPANSPSSYRKLAVNAAKDWIKEIPDGDVLVFRAEGAKADQLFRIYKKWFATHEDIPWVISEEHKSFFFYKKRL